MERILRKTFIWYVMFGMMVTATSFGQSAGFNSTFLVLQTNGGANTYYDLQATTANADFNGTNLGTFCQGSDDGLVFKGAEHNVFKCGGCDLTSTRVYYRIYPAGSPTGSFTSNTIGFTSGTNNGCGGQDQQWSNTGYTTNVLSGLAPGTYSFEVYSDASVTCEGGTVFAGNNGANYIATFTVAAATTYYADVDLDGFGDPDTSVSSCDGAPAGYVTNSLDCNDGTLYYVDNDGDGFGSTVFSPCQGVTNNEDCNDLLLTYEDLDGDGFGSTVFAPCGVDNNDDCNDNLLRYVDNDSDGFGSDIYSACSGVTNTDDCDDNDIQYVDADGDGWGSETFAACGVQNNDDCDDSMLTYIDDDGDGFGSDTPAPCGASNSDDCDDADLTYEDLDGDGFGSTVLAACGVQDNDDCNDNQLQYLDNDGDGFGSTTLVECGVTNNTDCDDSNPELRGLFSFHVDADGDGFGTGELVNDICAYDALTAPEGYSSSNADCDDTNAAISPGNDEVLYNAIDDNCDGNLDEGFQLLTQVQASQCGSTLPNINTLIAADSEESASMYRFEVTNTSTNEVQTLDRTLRWFALSMLDEYDFETTYSIRVMIQRDGIWLGYYGPACLVTTPAVTNPGGPAAVNPSQCETTLNTISSLIAAQSINNVTGYRFRVTNMTDPTAPNQVQVIDRTLHWFSLTMLPTFTYGTTYMIEVAVKTTGDFTDYGTPCLVTTPAVPSLANCDQTVTSDAMPVETFSKNRVTMYRFELTNIDTDEVMIIDRPVHWFRFSMLDSYVPSQRYSVRVALMTSGVWSLFGPACEIISPPAAARPQDIRQTKEAAFTAVAYPNPFTQNFSIALPDGFAADVNVKIYDMTGRLLESINFAGGVQVSVGERYPSGVYNVILSAGENTKTLRVVKR